MQVDTSSNTDQSTKLRVRLIFTV